MLSLLYLTLILPLAFSQDNFGFDAEGNLLKPTKKPLNFLKLVASKVKGQGVEPVTSTKPKLEEDSSDLHTENAKAELNVLKGLHNQLLETKDPEEKLELRQLIMEKVDKIERLLHKNKNLNQTETTIEAKSEATTPEIIVDHKNPDYFDTHPGMKGDIILDAELEDIKDDNDIEENLHNINSTTMQPLFEFDEGQAKTVSMRSKQQPKSSTTSESIETTTEQVILEPEKPAKPDKESFYPWESPECKDLSEACLDFKPLCSIFSSVAYRKCRKTCKMCFKDNSPHKGSIELSNF